jgi:hypothetical protein
MTPVQVLHENNCAAYILACLVLRTEAIKAGDYLLLPRAIHRDMMDHARRTLFALVLEQMDNGLTAVVVHPLNHLSRIRSRRIPRFELEQLRVITRLRRDVIGANVYMV